MNSSEIKTLIVIGGPTGVGKSTLAIDLALHFNTEIINADSRQIFKEMNIGVNKPSQAELFRVQHHLIGHVSIHEDYNASRYEQEALQTIDNLHHQNNTAILVGGTGLYIRAVLEGLDDFPDIDPGVKNTVAELYATEGLIGLQQKVVALDPVHYSTMDIENPRRLMRALEVMLQSGSTYSDLRSKKIKARPFKSISVFIDEDRTKLYHKIDVRVDQMIADGLEHEAKELYKFRNLKSLQTVGYTEWFDHFAGEISKQQAIDKIKQHTRNYAKRQWTWWKPLAWPGFRSDEVGRLKEYINQFVFE